MATSDMRRTARGPAPVPRPGDTLREAQTGLEAQIRELVLGFNGRTGALVTEINLRYLEPAPDAIGTGSQDVVIRVTAAL